MIFNGKEMAALLKAAKMMALADGNMTSDEKELELWSFISLLAGFPRMNIDEAISFWQSH